MLPMTMRWSYLGELGPEGRLDWGGSWSGNVPTSGTILPDNEDTSIYLKIREAAQQGLYDGRQVDWGAFAIKVNGPELLAILTACYGDLNSIAPESVPGRYIRYARALGSEKHVAFVSAEL
jgi:hypothetical protein